MDQKSSQTSSLPYLLRAMHEWMSDNGETPLVVVDATCPGVQVPEGHVKDGRLVLNVSWSATGNLVMDNEAISFSARFDGVGHSVYLPVESITAVYARESGQGMVFQQEETIEEAKEHADAGNDVASETDTPRRPDGPPNLKVVK